MFPFTQVVCLFQSSTEMLIDSDHCLPWTLWPSLRWISSPWRTSVTVKPWFWMCSAVSLTTFSTFLISYWTVSHLFSVSIVSKVIFSANLALQEACSTHSFVSPIISWWWNAVGAAFIPVLRTSGLLTSARARRQEEMTALPTHPVVLVHCPWSSTFCLHGNAGGIRQSRELPFNMVFVSRWG